MNKLENLSSLPLLPIKNSVLFPHLFMPLSVGRALSLAAAEASLKTEDNEMLIITQRDPSVESPGQDELFTVGCRAVIKKIARREGFGNTLAEGFLRAGQAIGVPTEMLAQGKGRGGDITQVAGEPSLQLAYAVAPRGCSLSD